MSKFSTTHKLPNGKITRRGISRGYYILKQEEGQPDEVIFVRRVSKRPTARDGKLMNAGELVANQGLAVQQAGRIGNVHAHSRGKALGKRVQNTRTGPQGRKAMVSADAVDSITESMEKRTRNAIAKIGKSIGF